MKVRLSFLTSNPRHVRSLMLREFGALPPYTEDICVLIPKAKVFAMLEAFLSAFEFLQRCGIVDEEAQLLDYRILDEDKLTLAYVF